MKRGGQRLDQILLVAQGTAAEMQHFWVPQERPFKYPTSFSHWGEKCSRELVPATPAWSRHGTSYQSGAKSTGAWMSHSSVSGPVNASKEKRLCSEAGGVAVKLGGQENRAAPAEGEMVICAGPVLQGAYQSIGLNFLSAPSSYHGFPVCSPEARLYSPPQL